MTTQDSNTLRTRKRWRLIGGLLGAVLMLSVGYTVYWAQVLRYHQKTDDAYVNGNVVQITPQISGTVVAVGADDTQFVKAGQPLVRLDQSDAKVALDQAEAQLARTVRDVRNLFATSSQLDANVQVQATALAAAQSDLERRQHLGASGAVSGEELRHALHDLDPVAGRVLRRQEGERCARTRAEARHLAVVEHVCPVEVGGERDGLPDAHV